MINNNFSKLLHHSSESSDEELDFLYSRKRDRQEEEAPSTPTKKVEDFVSDMQGWDPHARFDTPKKKSVAAVINATELAPDTPNRRQQAILATRIIQAGLGAITAEAEYDPESPRYHKKVVRGLQESAWASQVIKDAAEIVSNAEFKPRSRIGPFVNLEHINKFDIRENRGGGCHWLAPNDPLRKNIINIVHNPENGVWCGSIAPGNCPPKFSTFFPDYILDEKEFLQFVTNAEVLYDCDEMQIRQSKGVYFTCHLLDSQIFMPTAFPHFIHEVWEEDRNYKITDHYTISGNQVLDAYKALKGKRSSPVVMMIEDKVIIDIAPALATKADIPKGICFVVPLEKLKRL